MKEIKLTRGEVALVDDEDFERVKVFNWYAQGWSRKELYAVAHSRLDGKRILISMHRLILDAPKGVQVDHVNSNGLDNQRKNLRLCGHRENQWNQVKRRGQSRYKGVRPSGGKWRAQITHNRKTISLGHFSDEKEAAKAYDIAALKHFGKFANTNKMMGLLK